MPSVKGLLKPAAVIAAALLVAARVLAGAAMQPGDLASLLTLVGERVQHYYDRVTSIICTETVTQQELRANLRPAGKPRETTYELIVVRPPGTAGDASTLNIERTLLTVNGRPARRSDPPACTDPKSVAAEPLAFLLPQHQVKYRFSRARVSPGSPSALALDFEMIDADSVSIKWTGDCFDAEGGGAKGRVWLDPETYDVLQVETRLARPFRIPVPGRLGTGPMSAIGVERAETTVRFQLVDFQEPTETLLLPASMVTLTVFHGVPNLRTTQTFSNFRRFLAEVKIRGAS